MFGHKSNVSLVFDFMDTDLEVIIKDSSIVLTPANIKAYMLMTLQGLEYLHINWILHRVLIIDPIQITFFYFIGIPLYLFVHRNNIVPYVSVLSSSAGPETK